MTFKKQLVKQLILVGVVVALFVTFFWLFRVNIAHKLTSIKALTSQRALLSSSAENLSMLIKDWEIARLHRGAVDDMVPHKDDLVALSKDMEAIAKESGISLSFGFQEEENPKQVGGLGLIGFVATLDGSASKIIAFLQRMEDEYFSMKIDVLDFSLHEGTGSTKVFMRGEIFFIN